MIDPAMATPGLMTPEEALQVFAALNAPLVRRVMDAFSAAVEMVGTGSVESADTQWARHEAEKQEFGLAGRAYSVLAEAGFVRGKELQFKSKEVERQFGPVAASAKASFEAFAGTYATFHAKNHADTGNNWWGAAIGGHRTAEAFAGLRAQGEVGGKATDGDGNGVGLTAKGDALLGGRARAHGLVHLGPNGVETEFEAAAFAGAMAEGSLGGDFMLLGQKVLALKLTGIAAAGAGAGASYKFKARGGKVTVGAKAFAVAGAGGGGGVEAEGDLNAVGVYVSQALSHVADLVGQKDDIDTRKELTSPHSQLRHDLEDYASEKWRKVRTGRADNYVKQQKVQAIIDNRINRSNLKVHKMDQYDDAMVRLIQDTLISPDGKVRVRAKVRFGTITDLQVVPKGAIDRIKAREAGAMSGLRPKR